MMHDLRVTTTRQVSALCESVGDEVSPIQLIRVTVVRKVKTAGSWNTYENTRQPGPPSFLPTDSTRDVDRPTRRATGT
jgi:hypothetical protein